MSKEAGKGVKQHLSASKEFKDGYGLIDWAKDDFDKNKECIVDLNHLSKDEFADVIIVLENKDDE